MQVELVKASRHLTLKQVDQAAAVYKTFERKEPALRAAAATNLSFLYLLEGDLAAAAKYTDLALKTDRYKWGRQPNTTLTAAVAQPR